MGTLYQLSWRNPGLDGQRPDGCGACRILVAGYGGADPLGVHYVYHGSQREAARAL